METPLSFNVKAMLGLTTYDSDDDVEAPNCRDYFCLRWNPDVSSC